MLSISPDCNIVGPASFVPLEDPDRSRRAECLLVPSVLDVGSTFSGRFYPFVWPPLPALRKLLLREHWLPGSCLLSYKHLSYCSRPFPLSGSSYLTLMTHSRGFHVVRQCFVLFSSRFAVTAVIFFFPYHPTLSSFQSSLSLSPQSPPCCCCLHRSLGSAEFSVQLYTALQCASLVECANFIISGDFFGNRVLCYFSSSV